MDLEAYRYQWRKPKESEVEDSQLVPPRMNTTPLAFDQRGVDSVSGAKGNDSVNGDDSVSGVNGGSVGETKEGSVSETKEGSVSEMKTIPTNPTSMHVLEEEQSTNKQIDASEKTNHCIPKEMATEVVYTSFSEVLSTEKDRSKKASPSERDRMIAATSLEREKRLLEVSQEVLSPVTARPPAALATSRVGGLTKSIVSWGTGLRSGRRIEKIDLTGEEKGSTRVSLTELDSDEGDQ